MKTYRFLLPLIMLLILVCSAVAQDATTLYNEGVKLKDEKKIAEAYDKFKQAVALKPDYTAALYECGWCQNDRKDYEGALISLRKARVGWPAIPKVHFELGYAFEKLGKTDSAIQSYNTCLGLKPDYANALKQLGYINYNSDKNAEAIENFKKYEAAAKTPINDYLYWYRKGFCHNAIKEYANAKIALQKSLEFKTDYANTYLELGFASSRLKQDEEAINYYMKAMELNPKDHVAYNGIAEVYRDNMKDMNMAMSWYQKTLDLKPNERKAHFGMGYCLNSKEKYDEAISHLRKAVESEATYTAAYVELGYSLYMTGKYADAIENMNKALSLNPKNENARYYAALIYIKQRNKTMAQKMVDELKAISSKHAATLQSKVDAQFNLPPPPH